MTLGNILKNIVVWSIVPSFYAAGIGAVVNSTQRDTISSQLINDVSSQKRLVHSRKDGTVLYLAAYSWYGTRLVDNNSDGRVDAYMSDAFKMPQCVHINRDPTFAEQEIFDRALKLASK